MPLSPKPPFQHTTIRGKVTECDTGMPLVGAIVKILRCRDGDEIALGHTFSACDGTYSFNVFRKNLRPGDNIIVMATCAHRPPVADLALTETAFPNPARVGEPLTYTLTVGNLGPAIATDVTLTDTIPPEVTFVSSTSSRGSCYLAGDLLTCELGILAVGGEATVEIVVIPNVACTITNFAKVTANQIDCEPKNNCAILSIPVTEIACIIVPKVFSTCESRECFPDITIPLPEPGLKFVSIHFANGIVSKEKITPLENRYGFARIELSLMIPYQLALEREDGSHLVLNNHLPVIESDIVQYYPQTRSELQFSLQVSTKSELLAEPLLQEDRLIISIGMFIKSAITLPVQLQILSFGYCCEMEECEDFLTPEQKGELAAEKFLSSNCTFQ